MRDYREQIEPRIKSLLKSYDVDGKNDDWNSICNTFYTHKIETSNSGKFPPFLAYFLVLQISSIIYSSQLEFASSEEDFIQCMESYPFSLEREHTISCIQYAKDNPTQTEDFLFAYLRKQYRSLMIEFSEFSIYSKELHGLYNDLKAMGDSFFDNIESCNSIDNRYDKLTKSLQIATQKIGLLSNSNPSILKKIDSFFRRLYALISSYSSSEKYKLHSAAYSQPDSKIASDINNKFCSFFKIPKPIAVTSIREEQSLNIDYL